MTGILHESLSLLVKEVNRRGNIIGGPAYMNDFPNVFIEALDKVITF